MTSEGCKRCPYYSENYEIKGRHDDEPMCALGIVVTGSVHVHGLQWPTFKGSNPKECNRIVAVENMHWPPNVAAALNPNRSPYDGSSSKKVK